jgi:XapX domain-containing protein
MNGLLVSLALGLAVGAIYGLVQVRSPAPPVIALVGLLGMVLGERAVDVARHHFCMERQEAGECAPANVRTPGLPHGR